MSQAFPSRGFFDDCTKPARAAMDSFALFPPHGFTQNLSCGLSVTNGTIVAFFSSDRGSCRLGPSFRRPSSPRCCRFSWGGSHRSPPLPGTSILSPSRAAGVVGSFAGFEPLSVALARSCFSFCSVFLSSLSLSLLFLSPFLVFFRLGPYRPHRVINKGGSGLPPLHSAIPLLPLRWW